MLRLNLWRGSRAAGCRTGVATLARVKHYLVDSGDQTIQRGNATTMVTVEANTFVIIILYWYFCYKIIYHCMIAFPGHCMNFVSDRRQIETVLFSFYPIY